MKIQEVDIKNFRGYGEDQKDEEGFFRFNDLDRAEIILISGYNGYGKTSLYEAIEWCITDNVKALIKQTEEVSSKITLKKSNYLKFQSLYDEHERKREVVVRLVFADGTWVLRRTMCDSLHEDKYCSTIVNESGQEITNEDVEKMILQKMSQQTDIFFRLNFFGQANSENLVYGTQAKGRRDIFFNVLGMNILNDIAAKSDARSNPLLGAKLKNVEEKLGKVKSNKEKIDKLFSLNGWGDVTAFRALINSEIDIANGLRDEIRASNLGIDYFFKNSTLGETAETLKSAKIYKEKFEKEYEKDMGKRQLCVKDNLIIRYRKNQKFLEQAQIAAQVDDVKLQNEIAKWKERENEYQKTIDGLGKTKENYADDSIIMGMQRTKELFLTETLIKDYEKREVLYRKLCEECKKYGLVTEEINGISYVRRLFFYSEVHKNQITMKEGMIKEKRSTLNEFEEECTGMREMLLCVQTFVNKRSKIEKCPVCGGKDFYTGGEDARAKLLFIINDEISKGDMRVKRYNDQIVELENQIERLKSSCKKYVWGKYWQRAEKLEEAIGRRRKALSEYIGGMISCNEKMKRKAGAKKGELEEKAQTYIKFINKYHIEKELLQNEIEYIEKANQQIKRTLADKFHYNLEEENVFCPAVQTKLLPVIKRINLESKIIESISKILKYDIGPENIALLEEYDEACADCDELEKKKGLFEETINFRKNVNENVKFIQSEMATKYMENNELINIIYQFINPHPFFRNVQLNFGKTEMNIHAVERKDIHLDHVLSDAQRKVLALSIFLGLNMSVQNNGFEQICIDDPVQSMDDINMVSFIDLLRSLQKTKNIHRSFIIGTHDENFAKLLKIKFRHRQIIEYQLSAYSKEGPIIYRN